MMERIWHVRRGESQVGPYTAAELGEMAASGRILRSDLIWKQGMPHWQRAGDAQGLFAAGAPPLPTNQQGDSTGGLIPYKNPKALIAYYTGLFLSPCCLIGVPLGILPLTFGILGLRDRKRNPVIKGSVHAWIGIVLGGLSVVATVVFWIVLIANIMAAS